MSARTVLALSVALLVCGSIALIVCELATSQDTVRNYVSDIEGPVAFYAINTTVSVFLLWATALLFAVAVRVMPDVPEQRRLRLFYVSQVLVFAFLGLDDRFQVHEKVAFRLDIPDHYVLAVVAVAQIVFFLVLGGRRILEHRSRRLLLAALVLFAVMFAIDAFVPSATVLRLTIEDLAKTWSAFFFALWAWSHLQSWIEHLRAGDAADRSASDAR